MKFPSFPGRFTAALLISALALGSLYATHAAPIEINTTAIAELPTHHLLQKRTIPSINDWLCKPSPAHPRPLVLVHSTLLTVDSWWQFAPLLKKQGYCIFGLTYGKVPGIPLFAGINHVESSAQEFATFAEQVLIATGTKQIDVVGHSQGGILARYWAKYLGGEGKVHTHVGISPITHGTTLSGLYTLAQKLNLVNAATPLLDTLCPGCLDLVVNSPVMQKLNAGGDTIPGAIHANIVTKYDEVVTPYLTGFSTGPATNVVVQNLCMLTLSEHLFMINSNVVLRFVMNQLDPNTARTANCFSVVSNIFG